MEGILPHVKTSNDIDRVQSEDDFSFPKSVLNSQGPEDGLKYHKRAQRD